MHQKFIAGKHFITQSRPHMYKLHNSILFSREETIYFHRRFRKQKNPVQTRKKKYSPSNSIFQTGELQKSSAVR